MHKADFMHQYQKTGFYACISHMQQSIRTKLVLTLVQRMVLNLGWQKSKLDCYAENVLRSGSYEEICKTKLAFVTNLASNLPAGCGSSLFLSVSHFSYLFITALRLSINLSLSFSPSFYKTC